MAMSHILGVNGPVVIVSGEGAYLLLREFGVMAAYDRYRSEGKQIRPDIEAMLLELGEVAEAHVRNTNGTANGTHRSAGLTAGAKVGSEMTTQEAAAVLRISERRVRKIAPRLAGHKVNGAWRVSRALVEAHGGS